MARQWCSWATLTLLGTEFSFLFLFFFVLSVEMIFSVNEMKSTLSQSCVPT